MLKIRGNQQDMSHYIDFLIANSQQIEAELCKRLEKIRLSRNITQSQLANEAGVSVRTIGRFEKGMGVSLDTFIRILIALRIQQNLDVLLPDPDIRPIDRITIRGSERKRARPINESSEKSNWSWGDGETDE